MFTTSDFESIPTHYIEGMRYFEDEEHYHTVLMRVLAWFTLAVSRNALVSDHIDQFTTYAEAAKAVYDSARTSSRSDVLSCVFEQMSILRTTALYDNVAALRNVLRFQYLHNRAQKLNKSFAIYEAQAVQWVLYWAQYCCGNSSGR